MPPGRASASTGVIGTGVYRAARHAFVPLLAGILAQVTTGFAAVIDSDVCVYGGTSGGVAAAVQAKRLGKSAVLVVFNHHVGGMSSGGLGVTDRGNVASISGISAEFYR
ncbi:MAG TPA: hypothetical protein DCY13_12840, partial [Verrucomicrobiales bacterium]|nr:hypothetical protein [Verrucomicrobiales bacterium]